MTTSTPDPTGSGVDLDRVPTLYYQDEHVSLYWGNCLLSDVWLSADLLVFDPPYGRKWRQGRLKSQHQKSDARDGIAGDRDTAVRDTVLSLWGDRPSVVFGDLMLPPPAGTKQVLVFRKPSNAGVRGATAGRRRDLEAIYLVGPWPSGIGGTTSLVSTMVTSQGNPHSPQGRTGHPHAKPIDVMAELIGLAPKAKFIADPCFGSGSTLVAAKMLGLSCIGVELEEHHCETAVRRLSVTDLFTGSAS